MRNKIYVAGYSGLVGSALIRTLSRKGYENILHCSRSELDLSKRENVIEYFLHNQPEWVFMAAAKVGGILANNDYPVEFLLENLKIQNNLIEASYLSGVKKLLFLGSSCIYPKETPQPIKESYLLSSYFEATNEPYAIAKIAGVKLCNAYNKQYGTNYLCVMPANLYGPNDNYHVENAHALPMLLRRFCEAKISHQNEVIVWGTGQPKREYLYVDDLAEACLFLMENYNAKQVGEIINVGTGSDVTINELASLIKQEVGFQGEIVFDSSRPDGTMRKCLDVSKIHGLGWRGQISLIDGLKETLQDYLSNPNLRQ